MFLQFIRTGPPTYNRFWLRKRPNDAPTPFDKRIIHTNSLTPTYYFPIPPVALQANNATLEGWGEIPIKDGTIIQALASRDNLIATNLPADPIVMADIDLDEHIRLLEHLGEKATSLNVASAAKHQEEIKIYQTQRTTLEEELKRLLPFEEKTKKNALTLDTLMKTQETLTKSKETYKHRGDNYKTRADTAEASLKTKEKELTETKKHLNDASMEIAKLSGHKCPRQVNQSQYDQLNADYKTLDIRCQRYKRQRDEADREINNLRSSDDRLRRQIASLERPTAYRPEEKRQRFEGPTPGFRPNTAAAAPVAAQAAPEVSETWNQLEKARAELTKEKERNEKILSSMDSLKESLRTEISLGIREQALRRERESPYGVQAFPQRPFY